MFFLLFVLWVILNGQITWEIALSGLVLSALIELFLMKFMNYSVKRELRAIRLLPRVLTYFAHLVREIVKANWAVMRLILSPSLEVEPQLRSFRTPLTSPTARAALAGHDHRVARGRRVPDSQPGQKPDGRHRGHVLSEGAA